MALSQSQIRRNLYSKQVKDKFAAAREARQSMAPKPAPSPPPPSTLGQIKPLGGKIRGKDYGAPTPGQRTAAGGYVPLQEGNWTKGIGTQAGTDAAYLARRDSQMQAIADKKGVPNPALETNPYMKAGMNAYNNMSSGGTTPGVEDPYGTAVKKWAPGGSAVDAWGSGGPQFGGDLTNNPLLTADTFNSMGGQGTTGSGPVQDLMPPAPAGTGGKIRGKDYGSTFTDTTTTITGGGDFDNVNAETARAQAETAFWTQQTEDAKSYLDELENKYKGETDSMLASWDESSNAKYSELLSEVDKNSQSAVENLMRFKAGKGTARSSRTMEGVQEIDNKKNTIKQNVLAEKDRERKLYEMQLAGASEKALESANSAYQDARNNRIASEGVLFLAEQGLLLEQQQLAATEEVARQQQYIDFLKQTGQALDPTTGQTVQTLEAQLKQQESLASSSKDVALAQKYLSESNKIEAAMQDFEVRWTTDANGNQIGVWYDPAQPGVVQSATIPGMGGGGGGGGYRGGGVPGGVPGVPGEEGAPLTPEEEAELAELLAAEDQNNKWGRVDPYKNPEEYKERYNTDATHANLSGVAAYAADSVAETASDIGNWWWNGVTNNWDRLMN